MPGTVSVRRPEGLRPRSSASVQSSPPLVEVHARQIADALRERPLTQRQAAALVGLGPRDADFQRSWRLALSLRDDARGTDR